jgi:hypothetical protein
MINLLGECECLEDTKVTHMYARRLFDVLEEACSIIRRDARKNAVSRFHSL